MNAKKIIRRFFIPSIIVSAYYFFKFGCKISPKSEIDLSPFLKIGKKTIIGSFAKIKATDGPFIIGENVVISNHCTLGSFSGGVTIGDHTMLGPQVTIIGNNYHYDRLDIPIKEQGTHSKGIVIGKNVWVGAGSCILDGSKIEDGVIIAPNSVVSANIPENGIVQGNPAKLIFTRR